MFCYRYVIVGLLQLFGSWRATVKVLVSSTPDLAEYCHKFLINLIKRIPTYAFSVGHSLVKAKVKNNIDLVNALYHSWSAFNFACLIKYIKMPVNLTNLPSWIISPLPT